MYLFIYLFVYPICFASAQINQTDYIIFRLRTFPQVLSLSLAILLCVFCQVNDCCCNIYMDSKGNVNVIRLMIMLCKSFCQFRHNGYCEDVLYCGTRVL